jgi:hypothetical protein
MSIAVYTVLGARQLTEQQNAPTRRYGCTSTRLHAYLRQSWSEPPPCKELELVKNALPHIEADKEVT